LQAAVAFAGLAYIFGPEESFLLSQDSIEATKGPKLVGFASGASQINVGFAYSIMNHIVWSKL
jgi:hypothetical protein